jgi:hypothetical protein
MVDRDATRTRRVVRRATVPRPAEAPTEAPTDNTDNTPENPEDSNNPEPIDEEFEKTPLGTMQVPERPNGFPTEQLLTEQDAEAAELRQQLDELRRQLDDGPPPLAPARRRSRRPLLGVLVVGGTLGAIATATLVPWSNLDHHDQPATPSSSAPAPAPARPIGAAALAPRPAPAGSLPLTGPGIDRPGTMMVVQVGATGDLNVVEQAVLGPRGLRQITLALPSMVPLGGAVAELQPTVRNLRVSVNGTPTTATPAADGSGWTVAATTGRARTVQLSYRITGTVMRSQPSSAGRALAVTLPLLGQSLREQGLPLVVRAEGSNGTLVNEVSCPSAPAREMLCGMDEAGGWNATIPADATSPAVLLQLNLRH